MNSSEMGKRSWELRKSPEEIARLKEISAKGVAARKANKLASQNKIGTV